MADTFDRFFAGQVNKISDTTSQLGRKSASFNSLPSFSQDIIEIWDCRIKESTQVEGSVFVVGHPYYSIIGNPPIGSDITLFGNTGDFATGSPLDYEGNSVISAMDYMTQLSDENFYLDLIGSAYATTEYNNNYDINNLNKFEFLISIPSDSTGDICLISQDSNYELILKDMTTYYTPELNTKYSDDTSVSFTNSAIHIPKDTKPKLILNCNNNSLEDSIKFGYMEDQTTDTFDDEQELIRSIAGTIDDLKISTKDIYFGKNMSGTLVNNLYITKFLLYDVSLNISSIKELEHDNRYGAYNSLVKIDSTHFILAYTGAYYDGFIKTFSIDASYNITEIDSLEHDSHNGEYNSLVMIDSTHFILAYAGYNDDGYIKTFSIDSSYNITEIDSLEHDTSQGIYNSLVKIDSTHFILAYSVSGNGYIKTFSIDGSYIITEIDSYLHDTSLSDNSLVMIDSTHFILSCDNNDGIIKTFSIDSSYENITEINSLSHDSNNSKDTSLIMIDSTHFILAYQGLDDDGFIKTFSIDASYNITEIDSLEHDIINGTYNSLVMIDSTYFILTYSGNDYDGYVSLFSIDSSYNITKEYNNEFYLNDCKYNSLVMIDSTHFILSHLGYDNYGHLRVLEESFLEDTEQLNYNILPKSLPVGLNETDRTTIGVWNSHNLFPEYFDNERFIDSTSTGMIETVVGVGISSGTGGVGGTTSTHNYLLLRDKFLLTEYIVNDGIKYKYIKPKIRTKYDYVPKILAYINGVEYELENYTNNYIDNDSTDGIKIKIINEDYSSMHIYNFYISYGE